jgi:hypothetical protein
MILHLIAFTAACLLGVAFILLSGGILVIAVYAFIAVFASLWQNPLTKTLKGVWRALLADPLVVSQSETTDDSSVNGAIDHPK